MTEFNWKEIAAKLEAHRILKLRLMDSDLPLNTLLKLADLRNKSKRDLKEIGCQILDDYAVSKNQTESRRTLKEILKAL